MTKMTNEWIEWTGENRIRTPLRGSYNNNYLNNNQTNYKVMGLKTHSRSLLRPKGKKNIITKYRVVFFLSVYSL